MRWWNDVTRDNLPNIKWQAFGKRSFVHECKGWEEFNAKRNQLLERGYTNAF